MGDRKRVNLRVEEETKERWDEYVADSEEYTTLSSMIRTAVNAEVDSGHGRESDDDSNTEERFAELESRLDDVIEAVEELDRETYEPLTDHDGRPTGVEEPRPYPTDEVFAALPEGQGSQDGATAESLADELGYGSEVVRQTAGHLADKSGRVKRRRVDDMTVYWVEV